jgi:hypothetical protein
MIGLTDRRCDAEENAMGNLLSGVRWRAMLIGLAVLHAGPLAADSTHSDAVDHGERIAPELLVHLGLSQVEHRTRFLAGDIVHTGLAEAEDLAGEVTAVGAMMIVPGVRPADAAAVFVAEDTFRQVHRVERRALESEPDAVALRGELSRRASEEGIAQLLARPARHYNLSLAEARLAIEASRAAGDARERAMQVMAQVLTGRLQRFSTHGLGGLDAYVREDGRRVEPQRELGAAIRQLGFLEPGFPGLARALQDAPEGTSGDAGLYLMEMPFQGVRVLALSREHRFASAERALAVDMHFYANRAYNTMLLLCGVVPYRDGSLLFAVNHLFTDAVLGTGSGIKRAVARREAAAQMLKHLQEVRMRLGHGAAPSAPRIPE